MDKSTPEQGGEEQGDEFANTLSRICHGRPTWWLPSDYFDKQKADDDENGVTAESIKMGWNAVPRYRYLPASTHHIGQQFGIGPGHELYRGLDRRLPEEVICYRSKIQLYTRFLQGLLSEAAVRRMTWNEVVSITVLVYIATSYYNKYGEKQMTDFEQETRQRLVEEEERRVADEAEAAARRELMEVPPRRELPWEKADGKSRAAATPGSAAPATSTRKRYRGGSPDGRRTEEGEDAKKVCMGLESRDRQSSAQTQPAAVARLDTQIATSELSLFLSVVLKDPKRQSVTVGELLTFVSRKRSSPP